MQTTSDIAESVNKEFWANYRQILHTPRSPHVNVAPILTGAHWGKPRLRLVPKLSCTVCFPASCLCTNAERGSL
jgi:hypothetical protein